jgi:hypothetical protein
MLAFVAVVGTAVSMIECMEYCTGTIMSCGDQRDTKIR